MNDLADEEEVFSFGLNGAAKKLQKPRGKQVADVEAESVDLKFVDPEEDDVHEIALKPFVLQAELDEFVVSFPILIGKPVAIGVVGGKIHVKPKAVVCIFTLLEDVLKGGKLPSDVVENAVQNDADARFVEFPDEGFELLVCAEPSVYFLEIHGIVAVRHALEEGIEEHCLDPEPL